MVSDPAVHGCEGRLDRRYFHAHGVGAAGTDVCHSGSPGAVLLFVAIMAFESDYTHFTRVTFFGMGTLVLRIKPWNTKNRQALSAKA